jgi:hypothetical protein
MLTNSNPYLEQRLTYIHCNKRLATFPSPARYFSSLPNWDSTTPSYTGECVPPGSEGETHSLGEMVWGVTIPTRGQADTVVYTGYTVYVLCHGTLRHPLSISISISVWWCAGTTRTCCRTTAASCTGAPWRAGAPSLPGVRGRRRRIPRPLPTRPPPHPAPPHHTSSGTEPALHGQNNNYKDTKP